MPRPLISLPKIHVEEKYFINTVIFWSVLLIKSFYDSQQMSYVKADPGTDLRVKFQAALGALNSNTDISACAKW